jgi:hypothetical protein
LDLTKIIQELQKERAQLEAIISSLEQLQDPNSSTGGENSPSRRGRRSMDAEGRLEVSRRMKQYWEKRRSNARVESAETRAPHAQIDLLIA